MSLLEADARGHRSGGAVRSIRRIGRSLHTLFSDMRDAWRDPAIPLPTPTLRDYPISRQRPVPRRMS